LAVSPDKKQTYQAVKEAVKLYNHKRLHQSQSLKTPSHHRQLGLIKTC